MSIVYRPILNVVNNQRTPINTGVKPNQNTRIEIKCQLADSLNNAEVNYPMFGVRDSNGKAFTIKKTTDSGWSYIGYYGNNNTTETNHRRPETHTNAPGIINFGENYTDGFYQYKFPTQSFQLSNELYLFAENNNGNIVNATSWKIFYCKIYDGNTLIRSYVPVHRDQGSNNHWQDFGLLEECTNTFYKTEGYEAPTNEISDDTKNDQYIYFNGNCCYDLGIQLHKTVNVPYKIEICAKPKTTIDQGWRYIIQSANSDFTKGLIIETNGGSCFNTVKNGETVNQTYVEADNTYIHRILTSNGPNTNNTHTGTLKLGGEYDWNQFLGEIYYCKVWQNGQLVRDLVPRLSIQNTPIFWDLVNQVAYYPSTGNVFASESLFKSSSYEIFLRHQLLLGNTMPKTQISYIDSTDGAYINTGLKLHQTLNASWKVEMQLDIPTNNIDIMSLFVSGNESVGIQFRCAGGGIGIITYPGHENEVSLNSYATGTKVTKTLTCSAVKKTHNIPAVLLAQIDEEDANIQNTPHNQFRTWRHTQTKLYYCKIWYNNVLVRNFVPYSTATGVKGLLDLVENKFYTSPNGISFK